MPLYGADCPVAIVARASWPEERVVRGTLGTIGGLVAADPIDRTAIIFVGPGLAAEGFRESALYDAGYQRRFRGRAGVSLGAAIGRLAPELPEFPAGEVWLAGAGPGSLGCLTLEVVAALAAADAVVYDALVAPEVVAGGAGGRGAAFRRQAAGTALDAAGGDQRAPRAARAARGGGCCG